MVTRVPLLKDRSHRVVLAVVLVATALPRASPVILLEMNPTMTSPLGSVN